MDGAILAAIVCIVIVFWGLIVFIAKLAIGLFVLAVICAWIDHMTDGARKNKEHNDE